MRSGHSGIKTQPEAVSVTEFGGEAAFSGTIAHSMTDVPGSSAESCIPGFSDQAVWATEDDFVAWCEPTADSSNSNYDGRHSHTQSGREPLNNKSRNSRGDSQGIRFNRERDPSSGNRSKAIAWMFFKTKLCCKFLAGTCPYMTNCNFAHGNEELRKPPPNWQEITTAQGDNGGLLEAREEHQMPSLGSSGFGGENQRFYKGRHCKKFYTEVGCPCGDACTFLHDEQSKAWESVAISLGPTAGIGYSCNNTNQPLNWKARFCNRWETTWYCPSGAHGLGELNKYQGGLGEMEGRDSSSVLPDSKRVVAMWKNPTNTVTLSSTPVPHSDVYHIGINSQKSGGVIQRQRETPSRKWKGPDKISRVYGDWIDCIE